MRHSVFSSDMSKNPLDFFITSGSSCSTLDEAGLIRKDIKKTLLSGKLPPLPPLYHSFRRHYCAIRLITEG